MTARARMWWQRWSLSLFIALAVIGFIATIGLALWVAKRDRDAERRARLREAATLRRNDAQIQYVTYVLCRSEGRTIKQCERIAEGVVLPANVSIKQLEAEVARIKKAAITKLTVAGKTVVVPSKGLLGPRGATGARGLRGATGPQGPTGARGAPGMDGERGTTGARGPQGHTGSQGPAGARGPAGATGAAGPAGEKGDAGAPGTRGPAGPQGATGPQGPPGPAGPAGMTCPAGFAAQTIILNMPGGQQFAYVCIHQ